MSHRPAGPGPFGRLALFAARNRIPVGLVFLAITAIAAVIGLPPRVDNQILRMMPQRDPVVQATLALDQEGGVELVTLGFRDPEVGEGPSEKLDQYADEIAARLAALDTVEFVLHKLDPDLAYRIGLLQVEPDDVTALTLRLRGAVALGPALNPVVTQRLLDLGPVTERLAKARDASILGQKDRLIRVIVRPKLAAQNREFSLRLYDQVMAILRDLPPKERGLELVWFGGPHRHAVEDVRTLQSDLAKTSGLSLVLVLVLVAAAFRDVRATIVVFVPLVVANVITLGVMAAWVGSLNTFTSGGIAILTGLGIDFGVHLFARYRELRHHHDMEGALALAWDKVGPPSVTAGLTSVAGFMALAAASFGGFSQLGIMLAVGLLVCLGVMIVLVPVLLAFLGTGLGRPGAAAVPAPARDGASAYRLAPLGLMVVVLATGVVGATVFPRVGFDFDMSSMRAEGNAWSELDELQRDLAQKSYTPVVLSVDGKEKGRAIQGRLNDRIERGELPFVSGTASVDDILPPDQEARLAELQELATVVQSPNLRYLHASPARPMVEALLPLRDLELRPLTEADLPAGLLRIVGGGTDEHRILALPAGNLWDMRNAHAMMEGLREAAPEARIAGPLAIQGTLYSVVMRDMPIVAGLAFVLVTALVAIDLRRLLPTVVAVGTLLAGMVWAAAILHALGTKLTIVNIVGVPILVGIGVDVVIHLLHRLREEGRGGVRRAWATTGVASVVSTATTVASFSALLLADARSIASLGLLVAVGLTVVTVVGALLLPLAWTTGWRLDMLREVRASRLSGGRRRFLRGRAHRDPPRGPPEGG